MKKKTAPNPALKPTSVRTPAHGNGQLRSGNPGCRGGTGRPPNIIREMAREGMTKAFPNIVRIAVSQGLDAKDSDSVAAFVALARIGLPSQMEVGENPDSPILTPEERKAKLKALGLT